MILCEALIDAMTFWVHGLRNVTLAEMMDDLSRYLKPAARHTWVWWLTTLLLLGTSAWAAVQAYRLHEMAQVQKGHLAALQRANPAPLPPKPTRTQQDTERHWAALRLERSFAWYPLFTALEQVTTPDIALLDFVPDKTGRTLTLRGNARSLDALTDYLAALAEQPAFRDVYLSNQKKVQQNNLTVIGFEIRMRLRQQP